jgi:MoxR-like ATPase
MMPLTDIRLAITQVRASIQHVIVGQEAVIDGVLTALLAGGHVLLASVPGLGKTLLVKTLSEVLNLDFTRVQFTPDVSPTDILGTAAAHGPIFAQLLLADEINRAQPKTQAALLEAMQEHKVTLAGHSIPLDEPFIVLATQNPIEQEGTYPLPEAQLDRFLLQLHVPYPTESELHEIGRRTTQGHHAALTPLLDAAHVRAMQATIRAMPVPDAVLDHAVRIVLATHPDSLYATEDVKHAVLYGASPRGVQALVLAGKSRAIMAGRVQVTVDDISAVAVPALQHRVLLSFHGAAMGVITSELIAAIVEDADGHC